MYWITGILGIISMGAPYLFGYSINPAAYWTSLVIGIVLVALSAIEAYANDKQNWEYWIAGLVGLIGIAAPFVFGFSGVTAALLTSMAVGVVALMVAGVKLTSKETSFE